VSNENGKIKLFLGKDDNITHRIYDSHDGRESIDIEAVRLDNYFKNYKGNIDFIKMDIEGAEGGAIQGMVELLRRMKDVKMFVEFAPTNLKKFGISSKIYLRLLKNQGFNLYRIDEEKKKVYPINMPNLLKVNAKNKDFAVNLVCIKKPSE